MRWQVPPLARIAAATASASARALIVVERDRRARLGECLGGGGADAGAGAGDEDALSGKVVEHGEIPWRGGCRAVYRPDRPVRQLSCERASVPEEGAAEAGKDRAADAFCERLLGDGRGQRRPRLVSLLAAGGSPASPFRVSWLDVRMRAACATGAGLAVSG